MKWKREELLVHSLIDRKSDPAAHQCHSNAASLVEQAEVMWQSQGGCGLGRWLSIFSTNVWEWEECCRGMKRVTYAVDSLATAWERGFQPGPL